MIDLDRGANLTAKNEVGYTPLIEVLREYFEFVNLSLIEECMSKIPITPLILP